MTWYRNVPTLAVLGSLCLGLLGNAPTVAQQTEAPKPGAAGAFSSLEELHQSYRDRFQALERQRLRDLAALAGRLQGEEAQTAYQELFGAAIGSNDFAAAEPTADRYLASDQPQAQTAALAAFVSAFAKANNNAYDKAIQQLTSFVRSPAASELGPQTVSTMGEAFLQRLMRAGRYDEARQVGQLFASIDDPQIQQHFQQRLSVLDMLGKSAPPIAGTTIDGEAVSLADLQGKVVLVDFWATWCQPCVERMSELKSLSQRYGDRGFAILGVNLDLARQDIRNPDQARSLIRDVLIRYRVHWPNVIQGPQDNFAQAYGVHAIPANFLIGPDGKITRVELNGPMLEQAVAEAVGDQDAADEAKQKAAQQAAPK